ncbi:hypothetical protein D3C77_448330 [compost metagenome]
MGEQGMANAVGVTVESVVAPHVVLATGGGLLAVLVDLRFEQLDERTVQGMGDRSLVVLHNPVVMLAVLQLRHLFKRCLQLRRQAHQQLLELRQQCIHGCAVEIARVIRQVQAELLARVDHHGNRVIGVGTR